MKNKITLLTIKTIIVVLSIIIFFFIIKFFTLYDNKTENFANYNDDEYKPSNTRILYTNTGIYPWDRHTISSSIPYDIKLKKELTNVYYYEYDNETYNTKLQELYKSKREDIIIAVEGSSWSKWLNPKNLTKKNKDNLVKYYEYIYNYFENKLNNGIMNLEGKDKNHKIQIVHDLMKRYKTNKQDYSFFLFEIEMILYREGKLQGKHIKLIAITNYKIINIIDIRIVGVVSEDNIVLFPYVANDTIKNDTFDIFIPEERILKYTNEIQDNDLNIYDTNTNKELDDILYKKIINEYNYEDDDMSNNIS